MSDPSPTSTTTTSLRADSISVTGATVIGVAFIAPAAGMAFLPQIVAGQAGAAVPFVYLLAFVGSLFVATTIAQFARAVTSAGSFYAYHSVGLGSRAGFVSGWLLLAGYLIGFPQNMLAFGNSLSVVIARYTGSVVPWWVFTAAGVLVIALICLAGLGFSVRVDIALIAVEVIVLLVLALVIIGRGGDSGNTLEVFTPAAAGDKQGTLLFGLVFAILTFVGFEAAATASEETRNARRNIPRAIVGSVVVTGLFFLLITYAITIGFGQQNAAALAGDDLPLSTLGARYLGSGFTVLTDLAVLLSAFAVAVAAANGLTRVMYAMARDGALSPRLGWLSAGRRTPYVAIVVVAVLSLGLALGLGGAFGPYPQAYSYLGAFGGLPVILLYGMVCVSLPTYYLRRRRDEFRIGRHLVIPALGLIVVCLAIWGSYDPLPEGVYRWITLGFLGYLAIGITLSVVSRRKKSSNMTDVIKAMS